MEITIYQHKRQPDVHVVHPARKLTNYWLPSRDDITSNYVQTGSEGGELELRCSGSSERGTSQWQIIAIAIVRQDNQYK